ncbi:hypothetical protein ACVMFB_007799 [Bradyrhizobium sp. USDA 4522]
MLQAEAYSRLPRRSVDQPGIGLDLTDIGRIGPLDPADVGIVGIVVDVDDGREIVADAEPAQLAVACGQDRLLFRAREQIELLRARQRLKTAAVLEPAHQAALLVDEDQRPRRQRRDLGAKRLHLRGRSDVVVVLPGLAGIVEQDHPAEPELRGKFLQPRRNDLAVEAEDEEFADGHGHSIRLPHGISRARWNSMLRRR